MDLWKVFETLNSHFHFHGAAAYIVVLNLSLTSNSISLNLNDWFYCFGTELWMGICMQNMYMHVSFVTRLCYRVISFYCKCACSLGHALCCMYDQYKTLLLQTATIDFFFSFSATMRCKARCSFRCLHTHMNLHFVGYSVTFHHWIITGLDP